MSRPLWIALLLVPWVGPAGGAEPNVDVLWPKDVEASIEERAGAVAGTLAIDLRYALYESPFPHLNVLTDTVYDTGRSSVQVREVDDGSMVVDVLHPDGLAFRYTQPFGRFAYTVHLLHAIMCQGDLDGGFRPCTSTPVLDERSGRRVDPSDLRPGVLFGTFNRVTIEGPPGTFDSYGSGFQAAQAIAEQLGVPWNWAPEDFKAQAIGASAVLPPVPEFPVGWWIAPGVHRVACDCTRYSIDAGNVTGAGRVWFVATADGRLLQFGSKAWPDLAAVPLFGQADVERAMREAYETQGFGSVSHDGADLMFLAHHGLVWRAWSLAQAADRGVEAEWIIDAMTGEVIAKSERPAAGTGRTDATGPPWLAALVVTTAALALVLYRPGRRSDGAHFVLPAPPRFQDEDPADSP